MVTLRHFIKDDAEVIKKNIYPDMTIEDITDMIDDWNTCLYDGQYFEMFAVVVDDKTVGQASICAKNKSIASLGIEIYDSEQGKGYGSAIVPMLMKLAAEKKYTVILNQVRTDNAASIKLNEKFGFESDGYIYRNKRDKDVYIFVKSI